MSLLDIANGIAPVGVKREIGVTSSVNTIHVVNRIARVYMATCSLFKGKAREDVEGMIPEILRREDVIKLIHKGGMICDDDLITTIEAIRWTGIFVTTGKQLKFNQALIATGGGKTYYPELKAKASTAVWNTILLEDFKGDSYDGFGALREIIGHPVEIINRSTDDCEVIMR